MTVETKEDKFVNLNGEKIHINVIGDGKAIVFLHGGPGSEHRFFLPHVLPLSENFMLVLYDQRGCGRSELAQDSQYSIEKEVNTLELLRKELDLEKMNLFGESWGSMLALLYATKYPERVNKLFLTAAIGATAEGYKAFKKELMKRITLKDKIRLLLMDRKVKKGVTTTDDVLNILDPYYVFSKDTLSSKEKTSINDTVNRSIGEDILQNYDVTNKLHRLTDIPITVAQGSHDILPPAKLEELLIKHIPHAKLHEIQNCGHWTVVEKPDEINAIAEEFFAE
ncbi:alpha/beta fold hydrolase [Virgibacillus doumboii]|uniref:alpha/beta fold hydrolase n=1 Tax=Virgibacillus doumboii TaxID=2697503 RepID=UPI0013DE8BAF|nr:alpha/beta hydrolase [Virgibacillus doumboii]